jgi:hypothetical protein
MNNIEIDNNLDTEGETKWHLQIILDIRKVCSAE